MAEGSLRIIVAEDEAVIRMDLVEMLTDEGYTVVGQAPDGASALALVEALIPDVLLVDVAMPALDGIEVTRRVSEMTAVVVVTAFGQRDRVDMARDAGAMAYLVKPVGRSDLMPAIEMAHAGWTTLRDVRRAAISSSEAAALAEQRLADRRDVERAKGIVQRHRGLTEEESYRWLRQTAMDRRSSVAEVARALIRDTNESI